MPGVVLQINGVINTTTEDNRGRNIEELGTGYALLAKVGGVSRPRHPQQSPSYGLVERFYPKFEAVYEERYQALEGFWRLIIGTVVRKFLE